MDNMTLQELCAAHPEFNGDFSLANMAEKWQESLRSSSEEVYDKIKFDQKKRALKLRIKHSKSYLERIHLQKELNDLVRDEMIAKQRSKK